MTLQTDQEFTALKREVAELKLRVANVERMLPIAASSAADEFGEASASKLQERFEVLVKQWKEERSPTSRVEKMVLHPAYQQIIGLGRPAIPLLLAEIERCPSHWDWALTAITGADPVPKASYGKLNEISQAWIAWGRAQGYRW